MFYPGKIEQINVIFDAHDIGLMFFPIVQAIKPIILEAST